MVVQVGYKIIESEYIVRMEKELGVELDVSETRRIYLSGGLLVVFGPLVQSTL